MHLTRRAHAKVNLALSVGPPTSGTPAMHPIASWMHAVDLFDTVHLAWRGQGHAAGLHSAWAADAPRPTPIDWPAEKDLALRACRLLEQALGRVLPVDIRIEKRIPAGGGLGGGSSDAAAVLVGLRDLLSLPLGDEQLARLSAALGSDVAYFIDASPPRPALVTGLGDRIERLERKSAGRPIILFFPPFGCPTGPVYKTYDAIGPVPLRDIGPIARGERAEELFNDLLPAAERVQPALGPLRKAIERATGLPVFMSGSGSTLFILPPVPMTVTLSPELSDTRVFATRLI